MAEGILFSIAQDLLIKLGSRAIDEVASAWGFKASLEKLKNTIDTIKNMLLDAQNKQLESHSIRAWLQRVKSVVYDADDLFDEFLTVASRNKQMRGNRLKKEVKIFFSHSNRIVLPFTISNKIKKIREELDDIVKDGQQFAFVLRPYEDQGLVHRRKRHQSFALLDSEEVIGRDEDKKAIVDLLVPSSAEENVSVVAIVGVGGLGKTTLAHYIYNDEKVAKHFKLRLWVTVSDIFDIEEIATKIIMSATNSEPQILEMDHLRSRLRKEVGEKKYLLVLDHVWNEDREKWVTLRDLLRINKEGSKILVTTRSRKVATVMDGIPHELEGLSEEKSWALFKKMAFQPGCEDKNPKLVEAGKEIVKKCASVPLAIRTLGSLLYGEDESRWLFIKERSLAQLCEQTNDVMSILKYSYHHLQSSLKICFAYCALFPKDYKLQKETLINLWMAEGFLIPADGQTQEEVGEDYFLTLLKRCFFQDIKKDEWGNISTCKMHDLMHDLAVEVAGAESKVAKTGETKFDNRIRHLSFGYRLTWSHTMPSCMVSLTNLRTILLPEQKHDGSAFGPTCLKVMSKFRCLRVLDLNNLGVEALPSSIGKLIHLRYLNLSYTQIYALPRSIKKLQNLQTLDLHACNELGMLPKGLTELTNLRSVDVRECWKLYHMPSGMGVLTSLRKLTKLLVNSGDYTSAQLTDLKKLDSIRGVLDIRIRGELKDPVFEAKEAYLSSKPGILELTIQCEQIPYDEVGNSKYDEALLECMKPHSNLKKLKIEYYKGQKLPSWAVKHNLCNSLPNLVKIELYEFKNCQELPAFGRLPFLKHLSLLDLPRVEYMESSQEEISSSQEETLFFPALQELTLMAMGNLKGWWKEEGTVVRDNQQELSVPSGGHQHHAAGKSFQNLLKLRISNCPNLTCMPISPSVKELCTRKVNKNLQVLMATARCAASTASNSSSASSQPRSKLKSLSIDNVEDLVSLPKECLHHLSSLSIWDPELVSTCRLREVFRNLSSLRSLKFDGCSSLRTIHGGLEELTGLEQLVILNCQVLDLSAKEGEGVQVQEDGAPWIAFKSLRSLRILMIPKLVALPPGFQHLINLRHLEIFDNDGLKEIPEWISCLSSLEYMSLRRCPRLTSLSEGFCELHSLNTLEIFECRGLTKRCRGPSGEDYPKIRHIPLVIVKENWV